MPVELASGSFSLTSLVFRLESEMYPFGIGQHDNLNYESGCLFRGCDDLGGCLDFTEVAVVQPSHDQPELETSRTKVHPISGD